MVADASCSNDRCPWRRGNTATQVSSFLPPKWFNVKQAPLDCQRRKCRANVAGVATDAENLFGGHTVRHPNTSRGTTAFHHRPGTSFSKTLDKNHPSTFLIRSVSKNSRILVPSANLRSLRWFARSVRLPSTHTILLQPNFGERTVFVLACSNSAASKESFIWQLFVYRRHCFPTSCTSQVLQPWPAKCNVSLIRRWCEWLGMRRERSPRELRWGRAQL
jgi:hypothetical protein